MPFDTLTAKEAGRKGGRATKRKHGTALFSRIGKKGLRIRWKKSRVKEGR